MPRWGCFAFSARPSLEGLTMRHPLWLLLLLMFPCSLLRAQAPQASTPLIAVKVGVEADYGPFVYAGRDGAPAGLSIELLQALASDAGLQPQWMPARPLNELLTALQAGRLDVITSLRPTPERSAYLLFSRPYVSVPTVLVLRTDDPLRQRTDAEVWRALAGQAVAVGAGYAVQSHVQTAWPQLRWQPVPDDLQALRGLAERRFAAAVVDVASLSFIVRENGVSGITAGPAVGFEYLLSFGVRRDRPDILARIDKSLLTLPDATRMAVVKRWMTPLELETPPRWRGLLEEAVLGLLALGLLTGVWGWRRQLRASRKVAP
jgi:ABC-type amino acid transport substrate-binding protein